MVVNTRNETNSFEFLGEKIFKEHLKKTEEYYIFQALNFHRMSCICSKQFEMQQISKAPK